MTEKRELPPELITEGWHPVGDFGILWLHPPSRQGVFVDSFELRRRECGRSLALPGEPDSPDAVGHLVGYDTMHECGDPMGVGGSVWTPRLGDAYRFAREMRRKILGAPHTDTARQLTFDDLLGAK